jgi:hypothetical protein
VDAFLAAVVPLVSVLLGAGITYGLNVRQRRRTYVDDLFATAIAAVAVADASQYYMPGDSIVRPAHMTETDHQDFLASIARAALETSVKRTAEAREAIARVIPYRPELRAYYQDADAVVHSAQEIIDTLREGPGPRRGWLRE